MKNIIISLVMLLASGYVIMAQQYVYDAVMLDRAPAPALSQGNPKGQGYSPCQYTFNPGMFYFFRVFFFL